MKNKVYIKKHIFLESLEAVYAASSTEDLITLKQGLEILIEQRLVGGLKPYSKYYKGLISYGNLRGVNNE